MEPGSESVGSASCEKPARHPTRRERDVNCEWPTSKKGTLRRAVTNHAAGLVVTLAYVRDLDAENRGDSRSFSRGSRAKQLPDPHNRHSLKDC